MKRLIQKLQRIFTSPIKFAKLLGVKFGKNCYVSTKGFPSEGYLVEIGDCVRIAHNVTFFTHGGLYGLRKYHNEPDLDQFGKVKVGNYTSIGDNCLIMPGVKIGERCVIGAGSVVTKSVPDGCVVGGNPARIIGSSEDFYKRVKEKYDVSSKGLSSKEKKKYLLSLPEDRFIQKPFMKMPEKDK